MINKITNIVHIIGLLFYSVVMYFFNIVMGVISIKKHVQEEEAQEEEEEEEESRESFQSGNSYNNNNNNSIESIINEPLYKPTDFWANNINDYNDYSIEKTILPDNVTLPKNYALQSDKYEKDNTDYDYKDFNSTDGSGVHLQAHWADTSVARPWFLSRHTPMGCSSPVSSTPT
jgi:lipopolysaccharide export LptBFGC system permease protein LptF